MTHRPVAPLALALTASLLASCGGGGSSTPNPVTQPPPATATRIMLIEGAPFSLQPNTATFRNIDQPPAGTIDGTLDWNGART